MKYKIIKKAIDKDLCNFLFNYLNLKSKVLKTFRQSNYISQYNKDYGNFGDGQVADQYCVFGDTTFDTLLDLLKPKLEKKFKIKLYSTYTYARLYEKNGEMLPSFIYKPGNKKGIKVELNAGDMLVYKGDKLEHWREKFKGSLCGQVFLHYVDNSLKEFIYDKRPHLGLPSDFAKKN